MKEIVLEINNLSKSFKNKKDKKVIKVISNISFKLYENEVVGLLGNNGSGKSTLLRCISGLLRADNGRITLKGKTITDNREHYLSKLYILLDGGKVLYPKFSIMENLKYISLLRGINFTKKIKEKTFYYLDLFNLIDRRNSLFQSLSNGMQRKVAIIASLISENADLIIMDEPVAGLDLTSKQEFQTQFSKIIEKEKDKTFLIASHDLRFVENCCERVIVFADMKVLIEDNMDFLKKIFNSQTYIIEGQIKQREKLINLCNYTEWIKLLPSNSDYEIIEFNLVSGNKNKLIYDFINNLNNIDFDLFKISKSNPDLEFIYKNLVSKGKH